MRVSRTTQEMVIADGGGVRSWLRRHVAMAFGFVLIVAAAALAAALATWSINDPSLNHATDADIQNALGRYGAIVADILIQMIGLAAGIVLLPVVLWAWQLIFGHVLRIGRRPLGAWIIGTLLASGCLAVLPVAESWPLPTGLGGVAGDMLLRLPHAILGNPLGDISALIVGALFGVPATVFLVFAAGWWRRDDPAALQRRTVSPNTDEIEDDDESDDDGTVSTALGALAHWGLLARATARRMFSSRGTQAQRDSRIGGLVKGLRERMMPNDDDGLDPYYEGPRVEPTIVGDGPGDSWDEDEIEPGYGPDEHTPTPVERTVEVTQPKTRLKQGKRVLREAQKSLLSLEAYEFPPMQLLAEPKPLAKRPGLSKDALEQNARLLEGVLEDFGVRGEIIAVHPGPVVTLYELEPAPGIKSSRVIGLADDIARSMSAISARVAVIPGKNAIGIELPNQRREMVYLRELIASEDFEKSKCKLPLCLGKTIGGDPVIADLALGRSSTGLITILIVAWSQSPLLSQIS